MRLLFQVGSPEKTNKIEEVKEEEINVVDVMESEQVSPAR